MSPINERKEALLLLKKIVQEGAYSSILLEQTFRAHPEWEERSRSFISNLVYTVLSRHLRLVSFIDLYSKIPYEKLDPDIALILEMAASQLLWMDRVPESAAVNEAVRLASEGRRSHLAGYVNGVLREMLRQKKRESWPEAAAEPLAHLSVRYSIPQWILLLWAENYGMERTRKIAKALDQPRPISVRVNLLALSPQQARESLTARFGEEAVREGKYLPEALRVKGAAVAHTELFRRGQISIQDESSMLCVHALDPQPGERILDLCAAPGGKSAHIAECMKDRGYVSSRDVHPQKLTLIRKTAERLELSAIRAELGDAGKPQEKDREAWDRVLLDAPCSGLGVLRNKPDLKLKAAAENLSELAGLQKQFLETAAAAVKPGGVLVYSTCTLDPLENEQQAAAFLAAHPEFYEEDARVFLPESLDLSGQKEHGIYIWPQEDALDGFYFCRFRKTRK